MFKKIFIALLICSVPFFTLTGEESSVSEETVVEIDKIVITATRTEIDILNAPAYISVVTEEDFNKMGAKNIADVLSMQTGTNIRDYGPEGSLKNISIRGSSSEGVLVLIDGIRLNDNRAGGFNLSLIPLNNVEKIEIMRGGTSALYGADAVGGIINIITKKEADNKLKIKFENGSYIPRKSVEVSEGNVEKDVDADPLALVDTQKLSIQYSKEVGQVDIVTSGSFTRANNAYVWNDTEYIDDYRKRVNADMLGGDAYTGISIPLGSARFDITGLFSYSKKGTPGSLSWLSTDANQTDMFTAAYVHYRNEAFFSEFLIFDLKANYKYSRLAYEDPDDFLPTDDMHKVHSLGVDISQEILYFDLFSLVYGANLIFDNSESSKIGKNDRLNCGLFIKSPIYLAPAFTLIPVLRYDYYTDFPNNFNFKLSSIYNLSDRASFKASIAKSYRAPTLNDLYWPYIPPGAGSGESGNPDLKPETAYSAEAGVTGIRERMRYDVYAFTRFITDEIKWNLDDDDVWRPQNIGETLYPGIEAFGRVNLFSNFWLTAGYTFIYSFVLKDSYGSYDLSDDKRVLYVPVHTFNAGIEWNGIKNQAGISVQAESERFSDAYTNRIDPYYIMNAHYERRLTDNLTLLLTVNNLLNASYEIMNGYIMPPLFIRTGLEAIF